MRNKLFTLVIILTGSCLNLYAQNDLSNPDGFGWEVFKAFKTNDFLLFQSLLITEEKYEVILTKANRTKKEKKQDRKMGMGALRHIQSLARQNFDTILVQAEQQHIDWNNAEVLEVGKFLRKSQEGFERADIMITAQSGNVKFMIGVTNCYKGEVWSIMNQVTFFVVP